MKNRLYRNQQGITGLETAIILIAFVVVAAVFAYSVLSAGLFASEKSSEAVYKGLEEVKSTIIVDGALVAYEGTGCVDRITFSVRLAQKGDPVDFTPNSGLTAGQNKVVISYLDKDQKHDDLTWTLTRLGACGPDYLLGNDEQFQITISGLEALLDPDLQENTDFSITMMPPQGASLTAERTTPPHIDSVMILQ
ncbi:MAG: flagellin [Dehalococcoidia bacterium]|nr:flagellin [Dehalococcoidia bacterium]